MIEVLCHACSVKIAVVSQPANRRDMLNNIKTSTTKLLRKYLGKKFKSQRNENKDELCKVHIS